MPLRIVFCGTPAFGLPSLTHLLAAPDFSVEAVVTQPDRPSGRGQKIATSPVKSAAIDSRISVYQPESIRSDSARDFFRRISPDAVVIIAYGQIIPANLLAIPRLGWVNLHASLLPCYRGAAPIQRAILNGETRTGLTVMRIDAGLDTGPILQQTEIQIGADETAPELTIRMSAAGASLVIDTLRGIERGDITPRPQDNSRATFAPALRKEDGEIDWLRPSNQIYNQIRALDPWPGAYAQFRGKACHIWGRPAEISLAANEPGAIVESEGDLFVQCGLGTWLRIEHVKPAGRKKMKAQEFANGARLKLGERFAI